MQLVAEVSIPSDVSDAELVIGPAKLKKLRRKGLPLEWYVLFAVQMSYGHKNPSIVAKTFCDEWEIAEHELDSAIAKLQKKALLHRPTTTIQLELFGSGEDEQE